MFLVHIFTIWVIPLCISAILITGYLKGVKLYDTFLRGAKEGLEITFKIAPVLIAMFTALAIFRQSGALEALSSCLAYLNPWHIPSEIIGLALLRPLSGSGSLALVADVLKRFGPDSFTGLLASTLQGTTETTFYVLTVYLGAAGITRSRHCILTGLLADLAGFASALLICRLLWKAMAF